MTKQQILKNDPQTFTEAVYMHIFNGGRFNPYLTHPQTLESVKGWIFPAQNVK